MHKMPIDAIKLEKMSQKALERKNNKPIMEKKRRARINQCLNQLKSLILEADSERSRHSKLEKADILELTVKYLQTLRTYHVQMQHAHQIYEQQQQMNQFQRQAAAIAAAASTALSNVSASLITGPASPSITCSSGSPAPSSSASSPGSPPASQHLQSASNNNNNYLGNNNLPQPIDLQVSPLQLSVGHQQQQAQHRQHFNQISHQQQQQLDLALRNHHHHHLHQQQQELLKQHQRALSNGQISPTWRPW